jgi:hypothetical protein
MERRSTEEIARDIMSALQKATSAVLVTEVEVCDMIDRLRRRAQKPPRSGYQTDNEKYAKKVIKWINEGQKLYASRPLGVLDLLSWPGPFVPKGFEYIDHYGGVAITLEANDSLMAGDVSRPAAGLPYRA